MFEQNLKMFSRERFETLTECRARMEPKEVRDLFRKAIQIAAEFQQKEIELIEILKELDSTKAYRLSGLNSLFSFVTEVLKLTEHQALTYITLARKCIEVPEIQIALSNKEISVSKARRLCSVINRDNKSEWIELAKKSSQQELEKAVRAKDPRALVYDSVRYLTADFLKLDCTIDEETAKLLNRVKEVMMSNSTDRIDYNEILKEMAKVYLEKHDPLLKAQRSGARKNTKLELVNKRVEENQLVNKRVPLPAEVKHQVMLRDKGQCRFHLHNKRCDSKVHLEVHHKKPVSRGGDNSLENLVLICSAHHKYLHQREQLL